ncbi:hypothetical protein [Gramella sp. KN1008]|uniref:hypothetical protein n=1 Tax=Gramella sp. KN1008 TaxID=2529298 RepID=UPI0013F14CB8|nr:hypothetical protein [Gramella sp. KN1008]
MPERNNEEKELFNQILRPFRREDNRTILIAIAIIILITIVAMIGVYYEYW